MDLRRAALVAALAAAPLLAAPARSGPYEELPPGRYRAQVEGLYCAVCARAVAAEWSKLPEVEKVEVPYPSGKALIVVRLDRTLPVETLRRALRRAEKVANLGVRFQVREIAYSVSD